jgi:DNA helicase HerA-like ATPase
MLYAIELVTNGRNFKVRYGTITQFPTMIDRLLIKMTKQRYFGWTNEPDDIRYIASIIGREMAKELPRLDIGEFIYSCAIRNGYVKKCKYRSLEIKSYVSDVLHNE